jgi:DNA-binding HxlR family transcriptional regulator
MYEKKIILKFDTGIDFTKDVLYGKWKPCLMYLLYNEPRRPSELQRLIPEASRRILNIQLNELEEYGLVTREIFQQMPPKVVYSITELGQTLLPVLIAMNEWGEKYKEPLEEIRRNNKKAKQKMGS